MKKKFIALFAACSMITTAVAGLVQTAYAEDDPISVVVSDGASDTEKVLTINYACDGIQTFEGYLTFDNENVTINSTTFDLTYPAGMGDKNAAVYDADPTKGYQIMILTYEDDPMENDGKSVAKVNITVPGDVDVTATLTLEVVMERDFNEIACSPITVTIPKKSAPTPTTVAAEVTKVEKQNEKQDNEEINGTGIYANQKAVIYGVEITPNDDTVTGATVALDGKSGEVDFGGEFTGSGTVVFAVILASESGVALSELGKDNVTPKVKTTIE